MARTHRKPHTPTTPAALPATGFIRLAELTLFIPLSPSSIWRHIKIGTFPKPVKLSENITAWHVEDIRAWIKAKSAGGAA